MTLHNLNESLKAALINADIKRLLRIKARVYATLTRAEKEYSSHRIRIIKAIQAYPAGEPAGFVAVSGSYLNDLLYEKMYLDERLKEIEQRRELIGARP